MQFPLNLRHHPEQRDGEIYMGDDNASTFKHIGWDTKRKGKVPYDIKGRPLFSDQGLFPVFVQQRELEAFGFVFDSDFNPTEV